MTLYKPTLIPKRNKIVDGCPMGLAATLTQRKLGEQVWQVVQYASRSLSDTEKRYSQIELEALAGDFGCKTFHLFLYGIPFKMVTDHKPLESVFNKPSHATSIRVQRIVNRMLDYDFVVEYRSGKRKHIGLHITTPYTTSDVHLACVADETKPLYSPSANQRPKACSAPRVLPGFSIIGSNWLLHMAVLSCTVIGRVDLVEPWLRSR